MLTGSPLLDIIIQVVALPLQLINFIVTSTLNLLFFDILHLGSILPIGG